MLKDKKIILCDIDGVIIHGRPADNKRWDTELEKDLGIKPQTLQEKFFQIYWSDIIRGRRGLKECLSEVINDLSDSLSVDALIKYWFKQDSAIDNRFLDKISEVANANDLKLYIATDQEPIRKDYVYNTLGLNKFFEGIFCSAEIGFKKKEDKCWDFLKTCVAGYTPDQYFFIDDTEANVIKAKEHGIDGYLYTDFDKALVELF